jgi:bifunctional non-homologous end joining protein LigD
MIKSELLTEITNGEAQRYVNDDGYGCEEKHNGERRTICKDGSGIRNFNREGEPGKRLPDAVINALKNHPLPQFVIDVEFEKGIVVVLDALIIGDDNLTQIAYSERKKVVHKHFDNRSILIKVCKTVTGSRAKAQFLIDKMDEAAEGVVFKKLDAIWIPGKNGQHKKLKFWKSLDCVVMAPSPKQHNSVEVGLFLPNGQLHRICGVSLNGKPAAKVGQVIEIDYLYGTRRLEVVQPNLVRIRDDKKPHQCTIDQIQINKNFAN